MWQRVPRTKITNHHHHHHYHRSSRNRGRYQREWMASQVNKIVSECGPTERTQFEIQELKRWVDACANAHEQEATCGVGLFQNQWRRTSATQL